MIDQVEKMENTNSISLVQKMFEIQWRQDIICSGACEKEFCLTKSSKIEALSSLHLQFNDVHLKNDVNFLLILELLNFIY